MEDQFPSNTAVSLYFTASGRQGPGPITGSATGATRTRTSSSTPAVATPSATTSGGSGESGVTGASVSGATGSGSSTSKAGAAPTGVVRGMLGVVAGGALMVVL
jgi:hypothetical protein